MSHCFHVQNQHTDTFLGPAVDMLIILAAPQPPKYHDYQWIDRRLFRVCRALAGSGRTARNGGTAHQRQVRAPQKRSHAVVQLPLPEFLNHIGSAQTEVFGRPAAAAFAHETQIFFFYS